MRSKWLILIPALWFALFAKPAKANNAGEWTFSKSCEGSGSYEVVEDTIILTGPDQGGCSGQPHWVKIETVIPTDVDTVDFTWAYQTNDGAWYDPPQYGVNGVYVQLTNANNATGSLSVAVQEGDVFAFRQYSVDTCCQPGYLTISNLSLWESITSSTTTTTTSTTTVPSTTVPVTNPTTTTVQETTTTTTSVENSTSSSSSSSTTTPSSLPTTTTQAPTTTTSTTTLPPTTTSSTSTSSVPQTTTTVLAPTTTQPPDTLPPTPPQTTVPVSVETSVPTTLPETTTSTSTTTVVATTTTVPLPSSTTTTTSTSPSLPPATTLPPESPQTTLPAVLSVEEVATLVQDAETTEALVEALADLASEQVAQVVEAILAEEPTQQQATALATSSEVLAIVSTQEAEQIFEALNVGELSDTQTEELIAAIESAPTEIREEFEDTIDIFGEGLDDYTPVGSNIPVGTRRTLIAATAGITLAAAGTRIRR